MWRTIERVKVRRGYGKIKGLTFRISNMGDETDTTIAELLAALDASLKVIGRQLHAKASQRKL